MILEKSMTASNEKYSQAERDAIYRVIEERRDMRHFSGGTVDTETLWRLLNAAHHGPSVGYMQPWRFIRITNINIRKAIHTLVKQEILHTAEALGPRGQQFMQLKLEGIMDCAELLIISLADAREQHILGRRTLPEMDLASTACAIENMWLAARAEGLGMGWVSLFNPDALAALLNCPKGALPIALLCLGPVKQFYAKPMLSETGWREAKTLDSVVFMDQWPAE